MDYLSTLGSLALGSRLKRLSDRLGQEVATIYQDQNIDFEPRWFPVFSYVAQSAPVAITDIATAVGITHPAVNQIAQELIAAGFVLSANDRKDKRKDCSLCRQKENAYTLKSGRFGMPSTPRCQILLKKQTAIFPTVSVNSSAHSIAKTCCLDSIMWHRHLIPAKLKSLNQDLRRCTSHD